MVTSEVSKRSMEAILPYYCYGLRFSADKHNQISTNTMAVSYSHIILKMAYTFRSRCCSPSYGPYGWEYKCVGYRVPLYRSRFYFGLSVETQNVRLHFKAQRLEVMPVLHHCISIFREEEKS